jgi:hypothetical protein
MDLPDYAIEAKSLVKVFPATKTTPAKTALAWSWWPGRP